MLRVRSVDGAVLAVLPIKGARSPCRAARHRRFRLKASLDIERPEVHPGAPKRESKARASRQVDHIGHRKPTSPKREDFMVPDTD